MNLKSNPYLTALTIIFGICILNLFFEDKYFQISILVISALSVFSNKAALLIEKIWFKLSSILSQVIPNVILTILFFLLLTPVSLLAKVFRANSNFIIRNNSYSLFKDQEKEYNKKSFEKAW